MTTAALLLALLLRPTPGGAEPQFRALPGAFPGPTYWTEAVEVADVDADGDLDVFFARGEGWNEPGRKHQNGLFLNRLERGALAFTDASVERLGYSESHARNVVCGDVQGDGYIDALFANGFNTAPPYLFVNRGQEQPGWFRMESDARGLTEALSSASADFGDVDDDGDLDLIATDAGPDWAGPPGGSPRLYRNDGAGFFSDASAALHAAAKTTPMGAHLVDLDGDFDLDFFGPTKPEDRGLGHYLLLNDGSGNFGDRAESLPQTSGAVYEADAGDLDGDGDLDLLFVSLDEVKIDPPSRFPYGEGAVENLVVPGGELAFQKGKALGQDDDNEVGLFDFDQDGDLDAFIASLGPAEKVLVNDGGMQFRLETGIVEILRDPTLDLALGDLDNDGRVDLVTAQGLERIGSPQPPCQVFLNQGPRDQRPPRLVRARGPGDGAGGATASGPWRVHAQFADDVANDGQLFVTATIGYELLAGAETSGERDGAAFELGAGLWSFRLADVLGGRATELVYRIRAVDRAGNALEVPEVRVALVRR